MTDWGGILGSVVRAAIAGSLLFLCLPDWPSLKLRAELAALPDYHYLQEAEALRAEARYSEALLVVDAGLEAGDSVAELGSLRERIIAERDSWARRVREVGRGALTGQGESVEALGGAVVADLFVFGDIRDLVIQSGRAIRGEEVDDIIVALSAAGIVLTVAPELDLGAALLKFARRSGSMTRTFAKSLARLSRTALRERRAAPLVDVVEDATRLGRRAGPAPALRILRNVDDASELKLATRYAQTPGGSFALWLSGRGGIETLKLGDEAGIWLAKASRKGSRGLALLADQRRLLMRPHPLLGLFKGVYKGNVPDFIAAALQRWGAALMGFFAAWLGFEGLLCSWRCGRKWRQHRRGRTMPG